MATYIVMHQDELNFWVPYWLGKEKGNAIYPTFQLARIMAHSIADDLGMRTKVFASDSPDSIYDAFPRKEYY